MSYPLYYGQIVTLQAYNYGAGWVGATPGFTDVCGVKGPITVPDIFTSVYGTTPYTTGEQFIILPYNGVMPNTQTAVSYNDDITLKQSSTGNFWTIIASCHDLSGMQLSPYDSKDTGIYKLLPTSSSNTNSPIAAALAGSATSSTAVNSFYMELNVPGTAINLGYVYSDPNGNGLGNGSDQKTYFQFFLNSPPPAPPPQACSATVACPSGYTCTNNVCIAEAGSPCSSTQLCPSGYYCSSNGTCVVTPPPQTCTGPGTCTGNFTCINNVCQQNCVTTSQCTTPGDLCTNGICLPPACSSTSQCQPNYVCQGNTCIPIAGCVTSQTCNQGWTCQNNICVPPAAQCSSSQPCSFGKSCTNGVCEYNYIFPAIAGGGFLLVILIIIIASIVSRRKAK